MATVRTIVDPRSRQHGSSLSRVPAHVHDQPGHHRAAPGSHECLTARHGTKSDGRTRRVRDVSRWAPVQLERGVYMLWTIAVVLLVLWLLGLVTSYTMGGFIHILLVVAVIMVLVNLFSGRKKLT